MTSRDRTLSLGGLMGRAFQYTEFGAIIGFVVVFLVFSLISRQFLTARTFAAILTVTAELGILTVGIAFLMISGEFDLSVGSVLAVAAMTLALLLNQGIYPLVAFLICLVLGCLMGLVNGVITLRADIPSFITTLGMMMVWRGVLLAVSGGFVIRFEGHSAFVDALAQRFAGGFRTSALWLAGIVVVFEIVLSGTRYGNWVYATGGSKGVARAMGVNTGRVKLVNFALSGLLAAVAGCITFGRFKLVDPTLGMGIELEAIAAAVIGGALLTGGYGSIFGAFLGAFLVGMVRTGLILAGAPAYWYRAFI
ncbi:MAG: ABC transporter permease, partial [Deltaproteobacteria bacterium]|nr:ABC transporter permease [Deltaproteobacteria bacterium]